MMQGSICCSGCGSEYPGKGLPYCCPTCGGLFDIKSPSWFNPGAMDPSQPGIWHYRHSFSLPEGMEPVSLGEGNTPLLWADILGRRVAFKCEFLNPTGSFKDRGSAVIMGWVVSRGVSEIVEDSSGNAGASIAAYAARAGIKARIFVPGSASGPKRNQISAYGAELVAISGSRLDVSSAVKAEADHGKIYASHAYLPFNIPGYATVAYEIYEQLGGTIPGAVIVPVGQGGLLLGLAFGFKALRIANLTSTTPVLIGVQASLCSPIKALFESGNSDVAIEGPTIAEGIRVSQPLKAFQVVTEIKNSLGSVQTVEEDSIQAGRERLARLGFYVEPTSAVVWSALEKTLKDIPDPVVVVLTGSGYKYG